MKKLQEVLIFGGHQLKSLGDISNLNPSTMLIANADRLTDIKVHSNKLINTDLSECKLLQSIDISNCSALGTGIGAQPILNIQNLRYLKYLNALNTQITAIYTLQAGGNLEEIYYPSSIQVIQLTNLTYLHTVGIPYDIDNITTPKNLANVSITNCKNITKLIYPYDQFETNPFKSFKYVQNLIINNSLDFIKNMDFNSYSKLISVNITGLKNLLSITFDDMMLNSDVSTLKEIGLSNLQNINKITFNVSDSNHKVEFVENSKVDLSGLTTMESIESNYSIKGLDKILLPLSCKDIIFTNKFGDGVNEVKNIWSSDAVHVNDNYQGIDFKSMNIRTIDMMGLSKIEKGVNFNISPIGVNPNLNTSRDGSILKPWFRPMGSINLDNYTGDMKAMFKGLDLEKFQIILSSNSLPQIDISNLFESCTFRDAEKVNSIISKFTSARNLNYILKGTEISNAEKIKFPTRKFTLKGGFENSSLIKDIDFPLNVSDVSDCFKNCKSMVDVRSNWNKSYSEIISSNCYNGCNNIATIDGVVGTIEDIPVSWGGYGFVMGSVGVYVVSIPTDNFKITLGDLLDDGTIDWGDGNSSLGVNNHVYKVSGIYTIKGKAIVNMLNQQPHASITQSLLSVTDVPNSILSYKNMFNGCYTLNNIDLARTDTSRVNDISYMCYNCSNITSTANISLETIVDLSNSYFGCNKLITATFKNLKNTSTNIDNILNGCSSLTTLEFKGRTDKVVAKKIIDLVNTMIKNSNDSATISSLEERLKCLEILMLDSTTLK